MKMLVNSPEDKGCLLAIVAIILAIVICAASGVLPVVMNAISGELNRPKPVAIEAQTVGGALADVNGDTAATLTGYEMTFPQGTVEWRVVYASRKVNSGNSSYAVIDPTYWCKMQDNRWLSCQPVISEVQS